MSARGGRGGRGGGRGGRGGAPKRAAPPGMPSGWEHDPTMQIPDQPLDTYPKTFKPPVAPAHSPREQRAIASFLAFRREFHNGPLYTHQHLAPEFNPTDTSATDPVARSYDQMQANARFGVKNKATVDPFTAVPMYSHQFVDAERSLPELKKRRYPFVKPFFPEELWDTLDGKPRISVKRKLGGTAETEQERKKRIEEVLQGHDSQEEGGDVDDEEDQMLSEEDDQYEDDEGGDYDAEAYFDGGEADDDDEGVGESALDF